jgi:hypothetical protein
MKIPRQASPNQEERVKTIKYITRAAIVLALTIALQFAIREFIPSAPPFNFVSLFLVGSIVNLGLLLATETTGLWAGVIVGTLTKLPVAATAFMRFSFS